MSALHLLNELHRRDVRVWVEGGRLELEASAGVLTDELCQELRRLKPELLDLLSSTQTSLFEESPVIRESLTTATAGDVSSTQELVIRKNQITATSAQDSCDSSTRKLTQVDTSTLR